MKKKYKCLILIIGLVLVTVVGYWGVGEYQFQKEKKLILEIQRVADLSVKKQEKNQDLKCKGAYAEVEKSVKKYTIDYTKKRNRIDKIINNTDFSKFVSVENIESDAPQFTNLQKEITDTQESLDKAYNDWQKFTTEKNMLTYYKVDSDDLYYEELYLDILKEEYGLDVSYERKDYKDTIEFYDSVMKIQKEALELLKNTCGTWEIKEGNIYFQNKADEAEYQKLIEKLQKLA